MYMPPLKKETVSSPTITKLSSDIKVVANRPNQVEEPFNYEEIESSSLSTIIECYRLPSLFEDLIPLNLNLTVPVLMEAW